MKTMRWTLGAVIALAAAVGCGSTSGTTTSDAGPDSGSGESASPEDAATEGTILAADSAPADSGDASAAGEGGSKKMLPSDGASAGPFVCGTQTCDPATQYCEHANSNIAGGATTVSCVSFDGGCSPVSCSCLGLQATASAPGQCGCYESGGEVSYGFCPP